MALSGGKNQWPFYRVSDSGSAYTIKNAADAATATATTDALVTFTQMETAKLSPQEDGTLKGVIDNYQDNETFTAFLDEFAVPADGTSGLPEVKFLDGAKIGGSSSGSGKQGLVIAYGPIDTANSNKRLVICFIAGVSTTSGEITLKAGEYLKPTLELNSVKASYNLTIPEELFDSTYVDAATAGDQTIPSGKAFVRLWLPTP